MEPNKILNTDYLDLLFEGKNKAYGAYDLRKTYQKRLVMALIITGISVAVIAGLALLQNTISKNKVEKVNIAEVTISDIKQEEQKKNEPPPPPPPPPPKQEPPPKIETKAFTPPKVVKD
ncbi:MAG TPA: energy transducer TonB, partial [Niabella sp.]|nr:energy transducer TonB [Niabella sp.]